METEIRKKCLMCGSPAPQTLWGSSGYVGVDGGDDRNYVCTPCLDEHAIALPPVGPLPDEEPT